MKEGKEALYAAAVKATRITIVLYVIIKQIYFIALFGSEYLLTRTIANVLLLVIVFGLTRFEKAVKRHASWLIPVAIAYTEVGVTLTYDGDQTIYIVLAGCALLSLLFADIQGLTVTIAASWIAAACVLVSGFNLMGPTHLPEYNFMHFVGLIVSDVVIFLVGKYSIGTLEKSKQMAEAAVESMREAQHENVRMTERVEAIMNNLPGVVIQCICQFPEYIYTFVSEGSTELTGYSPEELTSGAARFLDIMHPDDAEFVEKLSEETLLAGLPFEGTFRIRMKDGTVKWIWERSRITEKNPDGSPHLLEGYYIDVTERKRLEAAELESKAKMVELNENMMRILDTMPIGVRVISLEGGALLYANKSLVDIRGGGETKEDIVGHSVFEFMPEIQPDGRKTADVLNAFAMSGETSIDMQCLRYDGEPYMARIYARTFDYMGNPALLVTTEDITEKDRMAENMRRAELAEASNKAKSQFLATMSHEIRTPMNSIMGFAELALDSEQTTQIKNYLGKITDSTKWLLNIVNDILDISKIETGKIELEYVPFNLYEIFARCQSIILPAVKEKGLDIRVYAEPIPGKKLIGDQVRLYQVLMNLLSNAVKFTDMGTVKFSSAVKNTNNGAAAIYFEVKDSGIGMTQEQIEKIFDPFVQADSSTTRNYGGTGLGLAITKGIVEKMGGSLHVESTPGVGSTFSFELVFDTVESVDDALEREQESIIQKPVFDASILICDDNPMNLEVICEHLARVGIRTVVAENGKEGVEKVAARRDGAEGPFDLIFMDMFMPVMDGMEAASAIAALETGTPIVAMTANVMTSELEKYKKSGMPDCLGKPFTSQELWRVLLKYLTPICSGPADEHEGDGELQKRLRINFVKNNRAVHTEIAQAAAAGDRKLAHRLAHTLKGNAGLVGKVELRAAAEEVEIILKDGVDSIWEGKMSRLKVELESVFEEFERLLDDEVAPQQKAAPPPPEQIQALFARLAVMLENLNPACVELLDELRAVPGTEELVRQIDDFEFEAAALTLAALKAY